MSNNLTGTTVSGTYGRLVQVVGGLYYDGNGNLLNLGGGTTSIGPQGPTGADGLQGPQGPTGVDGANGSFNGDVATFSSIFATNSSFINMYIETGLTMSSYATINFDNGSFIGTGLTGINGIALNSENYEWRFENGEIFLYDIVNNFITIKDYARSLPTVDDDITKGYIAGSYWRIDSQFYNCLDATEGAAVWVQVTNFGNLQQVTDVGNTTTNGVIINYDNGATVKSFKVNNTESNYTGELTSDALIMTTTNGVYSLFANGTITLADLNSSSASTVALNLINDKTSYGVGMILAGSEVQNDISFIYHPDYFVPQAPFNSPSTFYIPYKSEGIYTLATLDDIPNPIQGATGATGANGTNGISVSYYRYSAGTNSQTPPPISSEIMWNNATQINSTILYISHLTRDIVDIDVFLDLIKTGDILIVQDENNSNNYQKWEVSGTPTIISNNYVSVPVTHITGSYSFSNGHDIILVPLSIGIQGPQGATGSTGPQGATGSTGPQGATGSSVLTLNELTDVTITGTPSNNSLLAYGTSSVWENRNINDLIEDFNRSKGIYYFEDFLGSLGGNFLVTPNTITNVVNNGQGTTRTTTTITNRTNQQGVIESLTNAISTGTAGYNYTTIYKGASSITIETYIAFTNLSVVGEVFLALFGFIPINGNFNNPANAIVITYDQGGTFLFANASPNFKCVTRAGSGTNTTTITSIPVVAGQWYKLRITLSNDGSTATFFIDGVLVGTHSTNMPLNSVGLPISSLIAKQTGSGARAMQTDYFMYKEIFKNPR